MEYIKILTVSSIITVLLAGITGCQGDDKARKAAQAEADAPVVVEAADPASAPENLAEVVPNPLGKGVHDAQCIACHDSGQYENPNSVIKSSPELQTQLQRCNARFAQETQLDHKALMEIAKYLQQAHYRF